MFLNKIMIEDVVRNALKEDLGHGHDITSYAVIDADVQATAVFNVREGGVLYGLSAAALAFEMIDPSITITYNAHDGDTLKKGQEIAHVSGATRSILTAERVALNFLIHLSGIASLTRRYVDAIAGTHAKIADTRKTLPGLRALQKAAVRAGGGSNHRYGLDDAILIKDNHIAVAGGIDNALNRARETVGHTTKIEIEVDNLEQLQHVMNHGGADIVMLDNFTIDALKTAISMIDGRAITEASGGVTLDTVKKIAQTGVDYISVGALTHSAKALDIGLDM